MGTSLDSEIDLNLGRLNYSYSIIRDDNLDLSFLVGAHIATVKASITAAGNVSVNGVPIIGGSVTESTSSKTLPSPHIGGSLTYELTPKLAGKLTLLAFTLDVSEYSGSLVEVDAFMAYQLTKHFGIGGGLKYFNLNLQYDKDDGGNVEYDYQFFGPAIFEYVKLLSTLPSVNAGGALKPNLPDCRRISYRVEPTTADPGNAQMLDDLPRQAISAVPESLPGLCRYQNRHPM